MLKSLGTVALVYLGTDSIILYTTWIPTTTYLFQGKSNFPRGKESTHSFFKRTQYYFIKCLVFVGTTDKYVHPKILLFLRDDVYLIIAMIIWLWWVGKCVNFYFLLCIFLGGFNFLE